MGAADGRRQIRETERFLRSDARMSNTDHHNATARAISGHTEQDIPDVSSSMDVAMFIGKPTAHSRTALRPEHLPNLNTDLELQRLAATRGGGA